MRGCGFNSKDVRLAGKRGFVYATWIRAKVTIRLRAVP
jgi:hypothetical protein